jgi:hypothetical protein
LNADKSQLGHIGGQKPTATKKTQASSRFLPLTVTNCLRRIFLFRIQEIHKAEKDR